MTNCHLRYNIKIVHLRQINTKQTKRKHTMNHLGLGYYQKSSCATIIKDEDEIEEKLLNRVDSFIKLLSSYEGTVAMIVA